MVLSVDKVNPDETILILAANTGIFYEAQCGGVGCEHPKFEGFVIGLGQLMQDFDDCSYGCQHINEMIEARNKLANDLNDRLRAETDNWIFKIMFDFERIDELREGWWPVIVNGVIDNFNDLSGTFKCIIHTGNCD